MSDSNSLKQLALYTTAALALGWCGMALINALPGWWRAYQDSSLARYELMTDSNPGPVDYMIYHQDFDALEALAKTDPEILEVARGLFSGVGRVVFASAASPAIKRLRLDPNTGFMVDGTVPIICH